MQRTPSVYVVTAFSCHVGSTESCCSVRFMGLPSHPTTSSALTCTWWPPPPRTACHPRARPRLGRAPAALPLAPYPTRPPTHLYMVASPAQNSLPPTGAAIAWYSAAPLQPGAMEE